MIVKVEDAILLFRGRMRFLHVLTIPLNPTTLNERQVNKIAGHNSIDTLLPNCIPYTRVTIPMYEATKIFKLQCLLLNQYTVHLSSFSIAVYVQGTNAMLRIV